MKKEKIGTMVRLKECQEKDECS